MIYIRILILGFSLTFFGCDKVNDIAEVPQKPVSVPSESIWVGGLDGGVFVFIKEGSTQGEYWGEIHYASGDIAYKGAFYIEPTGSDSFEYNNPELYQGWDGDTIYLANDMRLRIKE